MGKSLAALVALTVGLQGCSYMVGVSALPTIDSDGTAGFEARLNASVGLTDAWTKQMKVPRRTAAVMIPASAGLRFDSRDTCYPLHGGIGYASLGDEPGEFGFKSNVLGAVYGCPDVPNRYGAAAQIAPLLTLTRHDGSDTHHYLTLGPFVEAALLGEADDEERGIGRFAFGPTLELYGLTYWTIGM